MDNKGGKFLNATVKEQKEKSFSKRQGRKGFSKSGKLEALASGKLHKRNSNAYWEGYGGRGILQRFVEG